GDLQIGRGRFIPAQHSFGDPGIEAVEHPGKGGYRRMDVLGGRTVVAHRGGDDWAARLDCQPDRQAEARTFAVTAHRFAIVLEGPPDRLTDRVLKADIAEPFDLFDRCSSYGVGRVEGRL